MNNFYKVNLARTRLETCIEKFKDEIPEDAMLAICKSFKDLDVAWIKAYTNMMSSANSTIKKLRDI